MRRKVLTVTLNPALDRTYFVDGFTAGEMNVAKFDRIDAGGKGINVARALKRFGIDALAAGLNGGPSGALLGSILGDEGIPFDFFRVSGDTRTNVKVSDLQSGVTTEINGQGFGVSEEEAEGFMMKLRELLPDYGYVVLSGSVPRGMPAGIYAEIIEACAAAGAQAILDADGQALSLGAKAIPYALKPNLKEFSGLTGKRFDSDREIALEARKLVETGIEWVAVTMGERGMVLVSVDEAIRAEPFPVRAVCTTGAGDVALAAFIYCRINGMPVSETAAYMTCAGTISSMMPGTTSCNLPDLMENAPRVSLEPIRL